jgi:hypothetical protein
MRVDYDLIFKLAMVCVSLVGAAKGLYELSIGRRSKLRDEYKFAQDFLTDVEQQADMHPYLKEKGYQAIAGDSKISGAQVEYLLSLTGPERALRDFVMGKEYLEHLPDSGNLQIKFKKKYERKWSRRWRMYSYVTLYFLFFFAGFAPLVFSSYLHLSGQNMLMAFVASFSGFVPYGWLFLRSAAKIYRAQMLVDHQDRHTQRIVLSTSSLRRKSGS